MDYEQLKTELGTSDYSGLTLEAQLEAVNAKKIEGPIPYKEFQAKLMQMACYGKIRLGAYKADTPDQLRAACFTAEDLLTKFQGETVDTALPAFVQLLGAFVQTGLVSSEEEALILDMAKNRISRAEQLWGIGAVITLEDIMRSQP